MEELIGKPAIEAIRWTIGRISLQGYEIKTLIFVQYPLKPHERTGQIGPSKQPGDETFLHLTPEEVLDSKLEKQISSAARDGQVLGITSTVFITPKKAGADVISHLFLLDIVRPPTAENIEKLKKQADERLGISSGIIVASSGKGMHLYADRLFSLSDWIALYGKGLLMNHFEDGEMWVDDRHIGHTLIPFPHYPSDDPAHSQPLQTALLSALRISYISGGRPEPYVVAVLE